LSEWRNQISQVDALFYLLRRKLFDDVILEILTKSRIS
jgi:hypothetical protein